MDKGLDRARGCLVGLAVGDAVGTTPEFRPRGSFPAAGRRIWLVAILLQKVTGLTTIVDGTLSCLQLVRVRRF